MVEIERDESQHWRWVCECGSKGMRIIFRGDAERLGAAHMKARHPRACTGSLTCQAPLHTHGCLADYGGCDSPEEHNPYRSPEVHIPVIETDGGPWVLHDVACPVCGVWSGRKAIYYMHTGVFQPCDICRKEGWATVRRTTFGMWWREKLRWRTRGLDSVTWDW